MDNEKTVREIVDRNFLQSTPVWHKINDVENVDTNAVCADWINGQFGATVLGQLKNYDLINLFNEKAKDSSRIARQTMATSINRLLKNDSFQVQASAASGGFGVIFSPHRQEGERSPMSR